MERQKLSERKLPDYTKGEEIFNMVSHIVGGAVGIAAVTLCVIFAAIRGNVYGVISGAIYGASMVILYTMSSVYHGLRPHLMAKKVFQVIDHCSIFLLIAGTYTPIALCSLREYSTALGWIIFGIIWGVTVIGILMNAISLKKFRALSLICYVLMGWGIVLSIRPLAQNLPLPGLMLLIVGGVVYTVGVVFYVLKKYRYMHSVWHLFVLAGSIFHYFSILLYVLK